jgi:hypothetical protein
MTIRLRTRRLLLGLLSLGVALVWNCFAIVPAFSQVLPSRVETIVLETFARDYQDRLSQLHIRDVQRATWQDCAADLPHEPLSEDPCVIQSRSGWQVTVAGEFPGVAQPIQRLYYVESRGRRHRGSVATLDALGSLSEADRRAIATHFNQPLADLQLLAAQKTAVYPDIDCQSFCNAAPVLLGWQVLVRHAGTNHIVNLNAFATTDPNLSDFFTATDRLRLGTLPLALANRVMRDAQDRLPIGNAHSARLQSVRALTWNLCHGLDGPTREIRGICPDVDVPGWEMVIDVGTAQQPIPLTYYIPQGSDSQSNILRPDGLKSISEVLSAQILQTVSSQVNIPAADLRLQGAWPQFLNQCLTANESVLACRNGIMAGWQVSVVWINSPVTAPVTTAVGPPLFVYNVNLLGTEARFVRQGQLMPPPP